MKDYSIRESCRLCSGSLEKVLDLGETCLANELVTRQDEPQDTFPLYLSRCAWCGHMQLPVVVNPERLFRDYVYQSGTAPSFVQHLHDFARDVQPKPGGFVVEIGSNDGTLLAEYKRLGFDVLGVDPAHNIAGIAELKNKVPTLREFFSKQTLDNWYLKGRKADLIVANNVFAHADDLAGIVGGVAELLAEDGRFVFEVGYLPDVIAKGLYRVVYHEHLSYHHLAPLCDFFEKFGLMLTHAESIETQGGSVRCFVRRARLGTVSTNSLRAKIATETPEVLDVSLLSEHIRSDKASLAFDIGCAKAKGQIVCGYGAPAQLTTTCAALGIARKDIAYIVDDNPLKQGKYTPGAHIPIMPPSALYDGEANVCVIFSDNFADEIMERHKDWGGEWVRI